MGLSPVSLYHPEVIQSYPSLFAPAYKAFWGLP
jgi:hypothetical protein